MSFILTNYDLIVFYLEMSLKKTKYLNELDFFMLILSSHMEKICPLLTDLSSTYIGGTVIKI
jgi:hypothetical protein